MVCFLLLGALLPGCEESNTYVEPPPPKVTVAQPVKADVIDYLEFTGTTVASARVEVPARVSGVLERMHFTPGTQVKDGDLLFEIDPLIYEADLQVAKAELASAEARKTVTQKALQRAKTLAQKGNVSKAKLDEAEAEAQAAAAEVLIRQAKLNQAQINLDYTRVTAPISGRVGRNNIDLGNLVGDGEATILTEITNADPIYAYFNLNERDLLRIMEMYRARLEETGVDPSRESPERAGLTLEIGLANEDGYPHQGIMDFTKSGLDPETGTLQMRGRFDNPGPPHKIVPGLFVRVRFPTSKRSGLPLVSERAIGSDQSGQYLLVVDSNNTAEKRAIRTGQLIESLVVVEDGLNGDEWIIVNGMQRARPGRAVDPEEADMASLKVTATQAAEKQESKNGQSGAPVDPDQQ